MNILNITFLLTSSFGVEEQTALRSVDLGPIYEPEAIHFSTDAPGWYILAATLLIFTMYLSIKAVIRYRKNSYRRTAISNIEILEKQMQQNPNNNYLADIMLIVKATAIATFGRNEAAGLYGEQWLEYLDSKGKNTTFKAHHKYITSAIYKEATNDNREAKTVVELTKRWIKTHA